MVATHQRYRSNYDIRLSTNPQNRQRSENFSIVASVQFQVLGPLRVETAGKGYELGGPKQRAVLAMLVASAGTPVSTDALIMDVYGADADPKARRSLQTYISKFRRSFGDVIRHDDQAYTLNIDPLTIDAERFERLVHRARMTSDDAVAAEMLRNALDMWGGRPYANVDDSATIESEAVRLEELHAEALETRIQLDLAAGRHRELLAELRSLTSEFPMHEGFRGHQMLAMYRCGRQADALRAYRQTRIFLSTELGLDPSPALQRLEIRILEQDPNLDFRPQPRLRPAPARYTSFVGRSEDLTAVRDLVTNNRLVTITGTGGIGKSSLAAEVARALAESMTTAFVAVDTKTGDDVVAMILASLNIRLDDGAPGIDAITQALSHKPTILLLDGCERILDQLPKPVSEILGASPSTHILLTSREGLFITGEHRFLLGPLAQGEGSPANQLFQDRAGISVEDLGTSSIAMVSDIGTRLSGLPLALELAAARYTTVPLNEIVSQLDQQSSLLVTLRSSHDRHRSIVAALDWSYELLDPGLRQTYRRLAVFRNEIPIGAAEGILEVADPAGQLAALAEVSLLLPPFDVAGYRMLEPVRQHALMRLTESGELDATLLGHADWIVELCENIRLDLRTGDSSRGLAKLRAHGPEIEATAKWALESNRPEITMAIVANVGRQWQLMFDPGRLRRMGERAIAHEGAPTGDLGIRALAHIAWMWRETDRDTAKEIADRLRSMIHETNDPDTLFDVTCSLAIVPREVSGYMSRNAMISRLELWDTATRWSTSLGWPSEPQLYIRAVLLQDLGRHDEAEAVLQEVLVWADESRPLERGRALHALARVETARGSFDTAIHMATEAAQLLVDAGDVNFAAEAQYRKAHALLLSNRPKEALRALDVIDQYHKLVGLPPAAEEDPSLVAAIAAGTHAWDTFRASMGTWFEHAPPMDDEGAWDLFLVGDASLPSQLGLLLYPTARWLASTGRPHEAARIIAWAPMAFAAMEFNRWEEIGEAERFRNLTIELEGMLSEDPPTTLRDLYLFIVDCIR